MLLHHLAEPLLLVTVWLTCISSFALSTSGRNQTQIRRQIQDLEIDLTRYSDIPNDSHEQIKLPRSISFPCRVEQPARTATSVHRLTPGDIKVIGALGDSLTAAKGSRGVRILDLLTENRGVSWTAGGEGSWRTSLTIPNILKNFNPDLVGYATGDGKHYDSTAEYNMAVTACVDNDLMAQAKKLVARMRRDRRIDYKKDWKMLTILIGHNDICSYKCFNEENHSGQRHKTRIMETLDYLQANLPRTFVNLLPVMNLTAHTAAHTSLHCMLFQRIFCACSFMDPVGMASAMEEYNKAEIELVNSGRYDKKEDFTVVFQPFAAFDSLRMKIDVSGREMPDTTFLAPDCFHISQKTLAEAANLQWNNMLEPEGNKSIGWKPLFERFLCPLDNAPYFFTRKNSASYFELGHQ